MEHGLEEKVGTSGQKEFSFPANVKQMGNIDKRLKIYIEYYVYTYIYQYAKTGGSKEKLMVLVGNHTYINDCDVVIVSGAIQGKYSVEENGTQVFTDESWLYINEQMRKYFDGMVIIGWCHVQPEFGIFMMARDEVFHKKCFKNSYQVFCTLDPMERQECFYTHNEDMSSLRPVKGYFIYYDKNEQMQDYMLENSISKPKEPVEEDVDAETMEVLGEKPEQSPDRIDAATRIRKVLNSKEEIKQKSKSGRNAAIATVTGAMCAAFLFMSVSMIKNMDRIQTLEKELGDVKYSYENLNSQIENTAAQVFAVKVQEEKAAEEEKKKNEETEKPADEQDRQLKPDYEIGGIYTIKYGDTLWGICNDFYGSPEMLTSVMEINGITDVDMLFAGERIVLPQKAEEN